MKRIVTLLLAAGLVLGAAAGSQAADIKAKGNWTFSWQLGDNNCSTSTADKFTAKQRLRTQIDVIASESLKGVLFLEMGDQNWGSSKDGASLGTDGKIVKVRYSYVDWVIPRPTPRSAWVSRTSACPALFPITPSSAAVPLTALVSPSPVSLPKNVGASLFWLRAENDNTRVSGNPYQRRYGLRGLDCSHDLRRREGDPVGLCTVLLVVIALAMDGLRPCENGDMPCRLRC